MRKKSGKNVEARRQGITARALKAALALLCACMLALLCSCGGSGSASSNLASSSEGSPASPGQAGEPVKSEGSADASGAAFKQPSSVVEPQLEGDMGGEPSIGAEHVDDGYVTAQAESGARLKFQVKNGEQTYNYDLPNDGTQTVYPINMGDGSYTFRIMQNTSGSNYVELYATDADVSLASEFAPYLVSNMYCDYDGGSACVDKAAEITSADSNVGEVVRDVCEYVAGHVTYDNGKAEELATKSGYVPKPDDTLATGEGICFDYASLSAAMLRSMGIPTKVMTGYVGEDELYHAWIMVYIDGTWHAALFDVDQNTWSRCDVTFASTGATKYVGDASAYVDRYTY